MNFYDTEYDLAYERAAAGDAFEQELLEKYPEMPWLAPEDRVLVSYSDVRDPDAASFWRYGEGHAVIIPGAFGE